jgi:hypothetical protein
MADDPLGLAGRTFVLREDGPAEILKAAPPHEELFDRMFETQIETSTAQANYFD